MALRRALALTVLLLAAAQALPAPAAQPVVLPCDGFRLVPFVGWTCERPDGLLEVWSGDGRRKLGLTHGPDAAPPPSHDGWDGLVTPRDPLCVDDLANDSYGVVVLARPSDQPDRYAEHAPLAVDAVRRANGRVHDEAARFDVSVDLKVACEGGQVEVHEAVLPTPASQAHFGSISEDLQDLGFTNPRVKHWVFYDDPTHHIPWGGQANFCDDDRLTVDNAHNGLGDCSWCPTCPMFAVDYGFFSDFILLHEVGHNLGAVQLTAPHTTSAAHCTDGYDVMCYDDGGATAEQVETCLGYSAWDCGHDDYFHPRPEPGNYLATHWNLGSPLNRFIRHGDGAQPPVVQEVRCVEDGNATVSCRFLASDDSPSVHYLVDWGDGPAERVPDEGAVLPLAWQEASHAYAQEGPFLVTVTAVDATDRSASRAFDSLAQVPNAAPGEVVLRCTPSPAYLGDALSCGMRAPDDSVGAFYEYRLDTGASGRAPWSGFGAPDTERRVHHVYPARGARELAVEARAIDDAGLAGPWSTLTVPILDDHRPLPPFLSCGSTARVGVPTNCTVSAVDPDGDGLAYEIEWGDGTRQRVPAEGHAPANQTVQVQHAWTAEAFYAVNVTATDDYDPPAASRTTRTYVHAAANTPPVMRSVDCAPTPPKVNETVTCRFVADDAEGDLSYFVSWGDGAWERIPAEGAVAPGVEQTATHAYAAPGNWSAIVTAYDERGWKSESVRVDLTIPAPPPCQWSEGGQLLAGLGGLAVEEVSARSLGAVPAACRGAAYQLGHAPGHVFAVCFERLDGSEVCDTARAGRVPETAASARVVYVDGQLGAWSFEAVG